MHARIVRPCARDAWCLVIACLLLPGCGGGGGRGNGNTTKPPAPEIVSFTASPTALFSGETSTLAWSTRNAASVRIDQGIGSVELSGSTTVSPSAAASYTLTASNSAGTSVSASVSVTVSVGPSVRNLPAPPVPRTVRTATKFGITYQAPGFDWLGPHYRYPFVRREVDRDFAMMASLAVETVKYTYNASSAFVFSPDGGAQHRTATLDPNNPYYEDCLALAPELLQRAVDAGMEPVVCFMTNEFSNSGPAGAFNPDVSWYEYAYKNGPGAAQMAADTAVWEADIVRVVLGSPARDFIYYYNLSTENFFTTWRDGNLKAGALVGTLPARVPVPSGKLAMDGFAGIVDPVTGHFLWDENITELVEAAAGGGATLPLTEWHDYPDEYGLDTPARVPGIASAELVRSTMEQGVARAKALLAAANPPGVTTELVIGETGASYVYFQTQEAQADAFEALWLGAQDTKAFFYGWGFWDNYPLIDPYGIDPGRLGFGFSPDEPRDILGRAVEMRSDLAGGDFESGINGWSAGSELAGGAALSWFGGQRGDAATGLRCLRLTVTKPGKAWICSPIFGISGRHAALSAYVRTRATGYTANLYTSRAGGGWDATPRTHVVATDAASLRAALAAYRWEEPPILPAYFDAANTWRFFQMQNLTPGFVFDLPAGANGAMLFFMIDAPSDTSDVRPVVLDLDTVSIHGYSGFTAGSAVLSSRLRAKPQQTLESRGRRLSH